MRRHITTPSRRAASAVLSLAALVYGSAVHADPLVQGLAQKAAVTCDPADAGCADAVAQARAQLDAIASKECDAKDQACSALQTEATAAIAALAVGCSPDDAKCLQAASQGAPPCDPADPACGDPSAGAAPQPMLDRAVEMASFLATAICPPYTQECADEISRRVSKCAPGDDACLDAVAEAALTEAHLATMKAVCDDQTCAPDPSEGDGPSYMVVIDPGCAACPTTCIQGWIVNTDPGGITNTARGDVLFERAVDGIVGQLPWFYWTHSGVITANDLGDPTLVRHTDMDINAVPVNFSTMDMLGSTMGLGNAYGAVKLNGSSLQHGTPGIETSDVMDRFVPGYHADHSKWQGDGVLHAGGTTAKQHDAQAVAAWEDAQPNGSIYYSVYAYENQADGWAGTHDHWTGASVSARGSMCSGTIAIATSSISLWGSTPVASVYDGTSNWVTGPDYLAAGTPTVTHDIGTHAAANLLHNFIFGKVRDKISNHDVNIFGISTTASTFLSSDTMDMAADGVADQVINCFAFPQASCDRMDDSWTSAGASLAVAPDDIQHASNSPWVNATEPAHILPRSTYLTHTGRWYCPLPPPVSPGNNLVIAHLQLDGEGGGPVRPHVPLCYGPGPNGWGYYPCNETAIEAPGETE